MYAQQARGDAADHVGSGQLPHGRRLKALAPTVDFVQSRLTLRRRGSRRRVFRVGIAVRIEAHFLRIRAQEEHRQGRGEEHDHRSQQEPNGAPANQLHPGDVQAGVVNYAHEVRGKGGSSATHRWMCPPLPVRSPCWRLRWNQRTTSASMLVIDAAAQAGVDHY